MVNMQQYLLKKFEELCKNGRKLEPEDMNNNNNNNAFIEYHCWYNYVHV